MNKMGIKMIRKTLLLATAFGVFSGSAFANYNDFQLSENPYISLSGYSTVVAVPDGAKFSVTVRTESKTAIRSKQDVDAKVANILARLKKAGLNRDAISSAEIWLRPVHRMDKKGNTLFKGYVAQRNIEVTVNNLDELGSYLDQMLIEGATELGNIRLISSKHREYQEKARRLAAEDAAHKAKELAEVLGAKLDRIWSINYIEHVSHNNGLKESRMLSTSMMKMSPQAPTYNDKRIVFSDQVDVVYKLK